MNIGDKRKQLGDITKMVYADLDDVMSWIAKKIIIVNKRKTVKTLTTE